MEQTVWALGVTVRHLAFVWSEAATDRLKQSTYLI